MERGQALDACAERLAVEVKRTWMGYRVSPGARDVESLVILGDDELSRRVAVRCGDALEMGSRSVAAPAWIEHDGALPTPLLTLVGVARGGGQDLLDFAHPHEPADLSARRRQMALVGALVVIVAGGVLYLMASQRLGTIRSQIAIAQGKQKTLLKDSKELYTSLATRAHLSAWLGVRTDWVEHLRWLSDRLPNPEDGLVNSISARLVGGTVVYTKTGDRLDGTWTAPSSATFSFSGSAAREGLLTELRERLLEGDLYRVKTVGPDVGDRYAFQLTTSHLDPGTEVGGGSP